MTLPLHPLATLFPELEGEEFAGLVASIKAHGLLEPITTYDGCVLDGRNRQAACEAADVDVIYQPLAMGQDPLGFVLAKNLERRHLTESQRAYVAAKLANLGEGRPEKTAQICAVSQDEAARRLNVSRRSVQHAAAVQSRGAGPLQKAVERGLIAVSAAAKATEFSEATQERIAREAEAGRNNVVNLVIKQESREVRERVLGAKQCALPQKRYGVILADPEWDRTTYSNETGRNKHASNHYTVSSDEEIFARAVSSIAAENSVLGLWTVDLHRGVDCVRAWGFEPKSYVVWVKDIIEIELPTLARAALGEGRFFQAIGNAGTGFWNRDRDEILIIATRGAPPCPAPGLQGESVWFAARPRDAEGKVIHSAKPECCVEWFERHFPTLPKIELNRRGPARPGWDAWGNEAEAETAEEEGAA
jgi:N6-adenosine-specific RNA methylase IME4/ParB-like chromosome segregation protein Spo0J